MNFRPSPLAYALAVVVAWIVCLAIAIDRVELFFTAIPLLVRILRSPAPGQSDVRDFSLATEPGPRLEGEDFVVTGSALIAPAAGPIEILPVLPPLLRPLTAQRTAMLASQPDGRVEWNSHLHCLASGALDFGVVFLRLWDRAGMWVAEFAPGAAYCVVGPSTRHSRPRCTDAARNRGTVRYSCVTQGG